MGPTIDADVRVVERGPRPYAHITRTVTMDTINEMADLVPVVLGRYATVRYRGHPSGLVDVTAALLDRAERTGHRWDRTPGPDGDHRGCRLETFHSNPTEVPIDEWVTEPAIRLTRT